MKIENKLLLCTLTALLGVALIAFVSPHYAFHEIWFAKPKPEKITTIFLTCFWAFALFAFSLQKEHTATPEKLANFLQSERSFGLELFQISRFELLNKRITISGIMLIFTLFSLAISITPVPAYKINLTIFAIFPLLTNPKLLSLKPQADETWLTYTWMVIGTVLLILIP